MGIFDFNNTPENDTQNAINADKTAYGAASNSLSPYTAPAATDLNNTRSYLYGAFGRMMGYGNPYAQDYGWAEEGPEQLYNQVMSGYSMSEGAQNRLNYDLSAANNAATMNGTYGGGDNDLLDAEITDQVMGQDEEQYLKNIAGINKTQEGFRQDYSRAMSSLQKAFGKVLNMEYGASGQMAKIAQALGTNAANDYARESNERNPVAHSIGEIGGDIASALLPRKYRRIR